ncbi:4268_t:CDS:2 [Gigaspora margarita]|uniref:4268_t:CDS:1 n=1 Tax=Gigaspora margarita TaxID=4874 RepID=A0ABN7W456_GIGMA|nr:4268_t:CDS:2 [Gigaspora margarita]
MTHRYSAIRTARNARTARSSVSGNLALYNTINQISKENQRLSKEIKQLRKRIKELEKLLADQDKIIEAQSIQTTSTNERDELLRRIEILENLLDYNVFNVKKENIGEDERSYVVL